jgi:hypothetical protein
MATGLRAGNTIFMSETNTRPKPTGGWQQYRLAKGVLLFYAILMLAVVLVLLPLAAHLAHAHGHKHFVPLTSHEPYHLKPSVLPPLK